MMGVAGMMSGLLGIGSGAFKVIAMDNIMRIPFKVSTTTSNFMMGVTAMASSVIYIQKGYIEPGICMPVVIGVLFERWLSEGFGKSQSEETAYFLCRFDFCFGGEHDL